MPSPRSVFDRPAEEAAPLLLGAVLRRAGEHGTVAVRLTEVEAYSGEGLDPGSHAHRGKGKRNAVMFGPSGHLYTYFTYGMHVCANVVCLPEGRAAGILLRAGEIIEGEEAARERRGSAVPFRDLARGPARLATALGIPLSDGGADLFAEPYDLELPWHAPAHATSARTGVSGEGGSDAFPWRFYLPGDATVSPYRAHIPKRRSLPPLWQE
ncbi:DNA-3-methyladenine glycosylase [Herbiconiux sp. L3-i23]|uniref:DNA-3-methyladenine glycosylase n=1 Tax=Herbiconiux sp. L3-i23 TaxID=2905871 RepID=UPI002061C6A0|nr:DNA-3-methyladenine glycosylase [Herbiconiux sp. L3-i23]BDI22250.1 putative 3-methyladenine DNA glycosylase [Herbiconiux sp. L3-i23]